MEIQCKCCGGFFETRDKRRKFCSPSCSVSYNNKGRIKRNINKTCHGCGIDFKLRQHQRSTIKYCAKCIIKHEFNRTSSLNDAKTDATRKRFLIEKSGHSCSVCKNTEWNFQPIPLEIDHIDGNHQNNNEDNIRLICPNCHAQTSTYKAKNKGNGRAWRRQSAH